MSGIWIHTGTPERPCCEDTASAPRSHHEGPLDGHPEVAADLHRTVRGFEDELASLMAAQLVPLSQEVVRLREVKAALKGENQHLRDLLTEAGLGSSIPPPTEAEEHITFKPQRQKGGPGRRLAAPVPTSPRSLSSSREEGSPRSGPPSRNLTLLASLAESASPPTSPKQPRLPCLSEKAPLSRQDSGRRTESSAVDIESSLQLGVDEQPTLRDIPQVDLQQIWKGDGENMESECEEEEIVRRTGILHRTMIPMKKAESFCFLLGEALERLIVPPSSHRRMFWEAIGAASIVYDLITVPLQAFEGVDTQKAVFMVYMHIVYWTLDLPSSFFVGHYVNGVLETRVARTAKKYLTTWFIVDICLVLCDWTLFIFEILGAEHGSKQFLMYGRVLRLLRFVRLVRLVKLHNMFNRILESIHSEYVLTFFRVTEHVLLIVMLNHFIACAWYAIGTCKGICGADTSWTHRAFQEIYPQAPPWYRYATSLHWSLTQFTPASMEVYPTNICERAYNVIVVILAMVTFSTFISSITEALTRLRKSNGLKADQHQVLRKYFGDNQVSMQLAMRVWRYLEHGNKSRSQRKMWRDVELFREIPDTLQMDLHHEVYMPILTGHPFFLLYNQQNPVAMRAICHYTTEEVALVSEQVLFSEGQVADKMFFIMAGLVEYQLFANQQHHGGFCAKKQKLTYPDWLCEAVVWVKWFYHGTATAKEPSLILSIDASKLHSIMKEYVGIIPYNMNYAQRFAEYFKSHHLSDIESDRERAEVMAQEAYEHVGSPTPSPKENQVGTAPKKAAVMKNFGRRSTSTNLAGGLLSSRVIGGKRGTRKSVMNWTELVHQSSNSTVGTGAPGNIDHLRNLEGGLRVTHGAAGDAGDGGD